MFMEISGCEWDLYLSILLVNKAFNKCPMFVYSFDSTMKCSSLFYVFRPHFYIVFIDVFFNQILS